MCPGLTSPGGAMEDGETKDTRERLFWGKGDYKKKRCELLQRMKRTLMFSCFISVCVVIFILLVPPMPLPGNKPEIRPAWGGGWDPQIPMNSWMLGEQMIPKQLSKTKKGRNLRVFLNRKHNSTPSFEFLNLLSSPFQNFNDFPACHVKFREGRGGSSILKSRIFPNTFLVKSWARKKATGAKKNSGKPVSIPPGNIRILLIFVQIPSGSPDLFEWYPEIVWFSWCFVKSFLPWNLPKMWWKSFGGHHLPSSISLGKRTRKDLSSPVQQLLPLYVFYQTKPSSKRHPVVFFYQHTKFLGICYHQLD